MGGYGVVVGSGGYDDEDRLVNLQRSDTNLDQSWNLSLVGNWNSITENASQQSRTHGPTHELLTVASQSVTHDAKGNMALIPAVLRPGSDPLKMEWDSENNLIAADTDDDSIDDIFYKFDALGRRVGRDDGTDHTIYFQDGQQTIADYPAGTAASSPTYTYVYASYIDEPVMRGGSGGLRYYHRNQQYSVTALTDGGGSIVERYAYTAYGQVTFHDASGSEILNSAISNRYTYTGREWDEEPALYHFRARLYDATAGRFLSRDPIGYVDGMTLYTAYFAVSTADPSGLCAKPKPRCKPKAGPEYKPKGTQKWKIKGNQMFAEFTLSAEFEDDPEAGVESRCCEVRQYIKWDKTFADSNFGNPPHSGFDPDDNSVDEWHEDRSEDKSSRYGYRTAHDPGGPGNSYSDPDQETGRKYTGRDSPGTDLRRAKTFFGTWSFKATIVDVCDEEQKDKVIKESEIITLDWTNSPVR